MAQSSKSTLRKWLGFEKKYTFVIWSISSTLLALLCIARTPLLWEEGFKNYAGPGEWYWYKEGVIKNGFTIHLACVVPIGILTPIQFIPAVRRKYIRLHRWIGNILLLLLIPAIASAVSISSHTFGGGAVIKSALYFTAAIVTFAAVRAYDAILRLEIDKHRRWMLRGMFWMSTIVTERILLIPCGFAMGGRGYTTDFMCEEARVTFRNDTGFKINYPACDNLGPLDVISVPGGDADEVQMASLVRIVFGVSWWLALAIHVIAVEYYIHSTKAEDEKLKKASRFRQDQIAKRHNKAS